MPLWPLKHASPDDGAFDRLRASIDPDWIEQALELTGTATLRRAGASAGIPCREDQDERLCPQTTLRGRGAAER